MAKIFKLNFFKKEDEIKDWETDQQTPWKWAIINLFNTEKTMTLLEKYEAFKELCKQNPHALNSSIYNPQIIEFQDEDTYSYDDLFTIFNNSTMDERTVRINYYFALMSELQRRVKSDPTKGTNLKVIR